jgi:hypothetical protein
MGIRLECACGAAYDLKDEFAGTEVRCPKCGAATTAPAAVDPAFAHDKYLFRQKLLAIDEKYDVRDEKDNTVLYIERPRMFLRSCLASGVAAVLILGGMAIASVVSFSGTEQDDEIGGGRILFFLLLLVVTTVGAVIVGTLLGPRRHITLWRDEAKTEPLLRVLQDHRWQFPYAWYTVVGPKEEPLGRFRKHILFDIFRKKWEYFDASGRLAFTAKEDSVILSLLRRLIGPLFGLLRTNFVFLEGDGESERLLGEYNRKFTLLDRYVLDLTPDPGRKLDRRIALAQGALLDTGEKR